MIKEDMKKYCLNCKNKTCQSGCPLENDIPGFIHADNYEEAYKILQKTTVLSAICGRICPHMKQCQSKCIRGIKGKPVSIGKVEAEIADKAIEEGFQIEKEESNELLKSKKVAVVGSGPAGLTCAAFLAKKGIQVTIFERDDRLGGILAHGIPEFRLPSEIVQDNIEKILSLGIEYKLNIELGKDITIDDLKKDFDAIFISIGANISAPAHIDGEQLKGVFGANELLENNKYPDFHGKRVAVLGGGNVAMDSARTVARLGAEEVEIIYRRSENEMPAEKNEIEAAKQEGIKFCFQTNIIKILGKDLVEKMECIHTKLIQKEGEKRLVPVEIKGSNYIENIDYILIATGSMPENKVIEMFEKNKWGYVKIDENMETSIKNVFAGGDIAGERATVAWAARSGRNAADKIIDSFIK